MTTQVAVLEVEKKALTMVDRAKALTISNNEECKSADDFCIGLKELEKQIIEHHKDIKEKAWATHKAAVAAETRALVPVLEARKIAKGKMAEWLESEEKKRRAEEDRLRKEAQKKADDDALKAAEEAERNGDKKTAAAILETPVEAAPVVLPKTTPKVSTIIQERWFARVDNPSLIPDEYWIVDESKLGALARATKGSLKIPGVTFYPKKV
jgi:hypothetical protein